MGEMMERIARAIWGNSKPKREPQTHDYTRRSISTIAIRDGGHLHHVCGFGEGVRNGDFLILKADRGGTTRYRAENVDYPMNVDPPTQWFADLHFAPRPRALLTEGGRTGERG